MGVVSGTGLDTLLARRLQKGDPNGDVRRAMEHFPDPDLAGRVLNRYFIPGGKPEGKAFKHAPMFSLNPPLDLLELTVAANFVEVFLAKENHYGLVGINYLEKIQLPTLPSLYGALLAQVDYVLMGAGIPRAIPAVIDLLASHQEATLKINVQGAESGDDFHTVFNPKTIIQKQLQPLQRPKFIAIVASEVLALTLARKSSGHVDGFVVEGPTAGGHNASPRGTLQLNDIGEPIYGPKDEVDSLKIRDLGLPFWLAGSYADPEKLKQALLEGAAGIQVGTAFAYCEESGLNDAIKRKVLGMVVEGKVEVFTDPLASPTGFPFKVVRLKGTLSEAGDYEGRSRICDLGYLRTLYKRKDQSVGYRCPAEPLASYLQKGGKEEETHGRKCLCNGLMATVGMGQSQSRPGLHPARACGRTARITPRTTTNKKRRPRGLRFV